MLNLKKAAERSKDAIYPKKESEFASILLPTEWKEMEPLTKNTRSYQLVKWGTAAVLVFLTGLVCIVIVTDWLESSIFTLAYVLFVLINAIKHHGNLFVFQNGIILHGKYYSSNQIKCYETEKIIRWHSLYGLDSRVNNSYKLTIKVKKKLFQPHFIVIEDLAHLEQIITLLDQQGILGAIPSKKENLYY